jgi:hypothetical protein
MRHTSKGDSDSNPKPSPHGVIGLHLWGLGERGLVGGGMGGGGAGRGRNARMGLAPDRLRTYTLPRGE